MTGGSPNISSGWGTTVIWAIVRLWSKSFWFVYLPKVRVTFWCFLKQMFPIIWANIDMMRSLNLFIGRTSNYPSFKHHHRHWRHTLHSCQTNNTIYWQSYHTCDVDKWKWIEYFRQCQYSRLVEKCRKNRRWKFDGFAGRFLRWSCFRCQGNFSVSNSFELV